MNHSSLKTPSYKKYSKILEKKGISSYKVAKHTGIGQATLSDWKHNISKPKIDKVCAIASYLDVPIEDLLETRNAKSKAKS